VKSRILPAIAVLAISTAVSSQTVNQNEAYRYDQTTEFTSRGSNGGNKGFVSAAYSYGLNAGLLTLTGSQYVMQDQDLATVEPWNVGTHGLDAAGDADYANLKPYASNLMLPVGTGIGAYILTHTLTGAPVKLTQTGDQWHHTWQFVNNANWTTDGLGVHMSQGATWGTPPTLLCQNGAHREIPRIEGVAQIIEDVAWSAQPSNQRPVPMDRCWRLRTNWNEIVLTGASDNSVYNSGCPNPNTGQAAIDPDFFDSGVGTPPRHDDYNWKVIAGPTYAGGVGILLVSQTVFPNGGLPTPFGPLHVDLSDPLFSLSPIVMPALDALGNSSFTLALGPATSPLRPILKEMASWSTQAMVTPLPTVKWQLSSLVTMRPRLTPTGFTAATAVQGTPASITRTVGPGTFVVRNDGRGELEVQFYIGTGKIGGATKVFERSMVRVIAPVAANRVEVTGFKTTATNFVHAFNM
jgi:hypothetical protein